MNMQVSYYLCIQFTNNFSIWKRCPRWVTICLHEITECGTPHTAWLVQSKCFVSHNRIIQAAKGKRRKQRQKQQQKNPKSKPPTEASSEQWHLSPCLTAHNISWKSTCSPSTSCGTWSQIGKNSFKEWSLSFRHGETGGTRVTGTTSLCLWYAQTPVQCLLQMMLS